MPTDDTYRFLLSRAADVVGGAQALCDRLLVPMASMTRWLTGQARPPRGVVLQVLDILAEERNTPRLNPPTPYDRRKPDEDS